MITKIWREEVRPFIENTSCRLGLVFFAVLAYGYFATNLSFSKDCLWPMNFWGTKVLFSTAYMMRWGMSIVDFILGAFGSFSPFVSVVVALPLILASALLFSGALNTVLNKRSHFAVLSFAVLSFTSAWYVEIVTYPNMLPVLGCGMLAATLAAISAYELYLNKGYGSLVGVTAALAVAVGMYEVCFIHAFMLLAILLTVARCSDERKSWPAFRWFLKLGAAVVMAIVLKFALSYILMFAGSCLYPDVVRPMFDACGTDFVYGVKGIMGGVRNLIVGLCIEIGFRSLTYFPTFFVTLSIGLWTIFVVWLAIRKHSFYILCTGTAVLFLLFFFPLLQGSMIGQLRKLVPQAPFLLAVEVYLFLSVVQCRSVWFRCAVFVFLVVFASNLSFALQDVVYRYTLDQNFALHLIHDIENRFSTSPQKKAVIVGTAAADASRYGYADGHAWRGVTVGSPTTIEKRIGWRLENGGFGAQGTLLDSAEGRRPELYVFLTRLGRNVYAQPTNLEQERAESYAKQHSMPAYPQDGSIVDAGDLIIVNLGL